MSYNSRHGQMSLLAMTITSSVMCSDIGIQVRSIGAGAVGMKIRPGLDRACRVEVVVWGSRSGAQLLLTCRAEQRIHV